MENYQYLNQRTELSNNQNKLNPQYNKNIQIQNFFRGDSNTIKPKNKIYNINSKKELHFSSRPKENEVNNKGPKILTVNFPPEFIISNNNSRKNSSHEKNLYLKNIGDNFDINNFEKNNHTKFANTVNNELEKINGNDYKNNNNKKHHQKLILINLNKREKKNKFVKKNNAFYSRTKEGDSAPTGLISGANLEYVFSETELNKRRKKSSDNGKDLEKENGKKFSKYILNHIKTEVSDYEIHKHIPSGTTVQTNYISDTNTNLDKNIDLHNFNRKKNIINSNIENESNTYINNPPVQRDNPIIPILIGILILVISTSLIGGIFISLLGSDNSYYSNHSYDDYQYPREDNYPDTKDIDYKEVEEGQNTVIINDNYYKNQNINSEEDVKTLIREEANNQRNNCPEEIKQLEIEFQNKYNIIGVNLCEMDPNFARNFDIVFSKIYRDYPEINGLLTNFSVQKQGPEDKNVWAYYNGKVTFAQSPNSIYGSKTRITLLDYYYLHPNFQNIPLL